MTTPCISPECCSAGDDAFCTSIRTYHEKSSSILVAKAANIGDEHCRTCDADFFMDQFLRLCLIATIVINAFVGAISSFILRLVPLLDLVKCSHARICCTNYRRSYTSNRVRTVGNVSSSAGSAPPLFLLLVTGLLVGGADGFCPHGCSCNDITVDCRDAALEVVPILLNPRVVSISLASNRITSLQESLIFYTDLNTLDLSSNQIHSLGVKNFEGQKILRRLNLDDNSIGSLQESNFYGLTNLVYLSLNNNKLTAIDNGVFKGLDSLESLQLVNNNIKDIEHLGFEYLRNIQSIKLVSNKLKKVPMSAISRLVSLRELNLCDNDISMIPDRAFQHLANLTNLNLSKNNVSSLHPDAFVGLNSLKTLSLLDNRLVSVPTSVFPPLRALLSLDLSGNMFSALPRDFLGGLPSLLSLSIERCPRLEAVSQDAFVSGWRLVELSLRQNPRLKVLPPTALAPLLALKTLDLSSCGLEGLQPTQIPMRELTKLDVSGNPLHCNCSLMWLAHVAANHSLAPGNPACAAPPALYGVPLRDLGSGTCGPAVGPWTIAGCVGVALAGLLTILAFLACRWRRNSSNTNSTSPPALAKSLQLCGPHSSSIDLRRQRDFTSSPLNNDLPHMQVYSSPSYYTATAPPVQFIYPSPRQPLHSCPPDCPCVRQSPALRPLLRTPSSTPTPSRGPPSVSNHPQHFVDFPLPPPPNRPPPAVSTSSHLPPHHPYKYPAYLPNNLQHAVGQYSGGLSSSPDSRLPYCVGGAGPIHQGQLLSTDWLYSGSAAGDDPQQHWYASIDRSSSSCTGQGNESSGYWEEDKELPATASLLPLGKKPSAPLPAAAAAAQHSSQESPTPHQPPSGAGTPPTVEEVAVPTSYI